MGPTTCPGPVQLYCLNSLSGCLLFMANLFVVFIINMNSLFDNFSDIDEFDNCDNLTNFGDFDGFDNVDDFYYSNYSGNRISSN